MTNKQIVFDILRKDTNGRYRDNLSKPKSIERCSRGLQNEYPGLRGNKWVERQAKADEIKTNQSKAFEL